VLTVQLDDRLPACVIDPAHDDPFVVGVNTGLLFSFALLLYAKMCFKVRTQNTNDPED
jgi:hypothetical protein